MKNFGSILVAYMIGWGVFFAYFLSIARRTAALRKDLQRINSLIKTNESSAKEPVGRGK